MIFFPATLYEPRFNRFNRYQYVSPGLGVPAVGASLGAMGRVDFWVAYAQANPHTVNIL
jgi:hypothetical protein